ncbi:hypothetical protein [Bradyrhizobium centrolobii]|uniref:hypothetical protein n=1 Tax=Bradyrhizobium centrolobii TaxID=1505087 RepID=UPI0010A95639|nr:hypothetical protein [Bradyrhizobium centrolobii]
MTHFPAADQNGTSPAVSGRNFPYRFGSVHVQCGRGRAALNCINGYLKNLIATIASVKVRRMQRELELRGIRFDAANETWITAEHRRPRIGGQ